MSASHETERVSGHIPKIETKTSAPAAEGLPSDGRRPVILVADDARTVRLLYRSALEAAGFHVVEAENGAAALTAFERLTPAITLLDGVMPVMDGFAACAALRKTKAGRHASILLVTSLDDATSIERAYDAGATDFVNKPVNWTILVHRLRYMLRADETVRRLEESERRLAEAQRIAAMGNFVWRLGAGTFESSDELRRIFGLASEGGPVRVRSILRRVATVERAGLIDAVRTVLRDPAPLQHDLSIPARGQDRRHIEVRGEVIVDAAGQIKIQGTVQDISERKQVEAALDAARRAAESADEVKTALLNAMNHELRTPLNAIIGFGEVISGEILGPIGEVRYKQFATDILHAGRHMLDLVGNVLDMAKLASEHYELNFEPTDLRRVASDALAAAREAEAAQGRALSLGDWQMPTFAKVDARAVKLMLNHLLSNALKFSAAATPIEVSCAPSASGELWLTVVDQGIGMTPEEAAMASEPFCQIDHRLARKYEGLGIGLSIVNKLIACHGGRLAIASRPGEGSRISLVFPKGLVCAEAV